MTAMMKRRDFITLLGAAAMWPLAARAQQPDRVLRVGVLLPATPDDARYQTWAGAFPAGSLGIEFPGSTELRMMVLENSE